MTELTKAELQQRQQAARKHGVYAVQARGTDAMTTPQRSRAVELREQLAARDGVVDALRDAAVNTVSIAEIAQSYCIQQHEQGRKLESIPIFRSLPGYWNSAGRALKALLDAMPKDAQAIDVTDLLRGDGGET